MITTAERTARSIVSRSGWGRWAAATARRRDRAVQESIGTTESAAAITEARPEPTMAAATPAATAWPP